MMQSRTKLHESLNLWDILQDGTVLGAGGEAAALYLLRPLKDVTLLDEAACQNYLRAAQQALLSLPAGCCLSFFVNIEDDGNSRAGALRQRLGGASGAVDEILNARLAAMQKSKERRTNVYLCLAVQSLDFLKAPFLPKTGFSIAPSASLRKKYQEAAEKLKNLERILASQLGACSALERLGAEAAKSFYWRLLNPSKAQAGIAPMGKQPYLSLRSQLALSPAKDEKDHFWVDGLYHRGVSLYSLGEYLELGGTDRLLSKLPAGSMLAAHFMGVDLESALDRAKAGARRSEGLAFLQGSKNYEAQAKARELDELVTLARSSGERLLIASMSLLLRGSELESLRSKTQASLTFMREAFGAEGLEEDLQHKGLFFAGLPFGAPLSPRRHTLTSHACAHLAPLSLPWEGCANPGILFGSRQGATISLDPFDGETPRHGIVIGSTGSGKSFTMNYLASSLYAMNPSTRFVIVDVGGSYQRLCEVLAGQYYEVNLSRNFALNPFPPREAILDEKGEFDADLTGYLSLLVEKMLEGPSNQNRRRIIDKTLKHLYKSPSQRAPLLGDFAAILSQFPGDEQDRAEAVGMARELRLFTEGSYASIFNSPAGINPFAGRLAVFDLAKLKEHRHLQGILIAVIGFGLARQMAQKDVRKVVILDEGWEFFDDDNASELVSRLYRTARKFNAMIISVSQSPKDFLKSKAATAMLANSYWKAILRLDMGHSELSEFGLNPRQIEAVKSLSMEKRRWSELLLIFGDRSRVLRVEPSSLEYWISTTNAQECALETELMRGHVGKSRFEIVKELAAKEPAYAA